MSLKQGGYIYTRVSSKQQSKYLEGHTSLEVQRQECQKYCDTNDINVIKCIREVYSAKNMDKMNGLKYLCNIASRGQTIYVYDISRFSRNTREALNLLENLKEKGVSLFSVTEELGYNSVASRNQFRLQLCAANYVSEICSLKVKASIEFRRIRGDVIGSVGYGFKTEVDKETGIRCKIEVEEEMKVISLIRDNKHLQPYDIVNILISKNIKIKGNIPTVKRIVGIISRFSTDLKYGKVVKQKKIHGNKKPY